MRRVCSAYWCHGHACCRISGKVDPVEDLFGQESGITIAAEASRLTMRYLCAPNNYSGPERKFSWFAFSLEHLPSNCPKKILQRVLCGVEQRKHLTSWVCPSYPTTSYSVLWWTCKPQQTRVFDLRERHETEFAHVSLNGRIEFPICQVTVRHTLADFWV